MRWARPHDGVYFRRPNAAERAVLDIARADLLRSWDTGGEDMQSSAYLMIRKTLDGMRVERVRLKNPREYWKTRKRFKKSA